MKGKSIVGEGVLGPPLKGANVVRFKNTFAKIKHFVGAIGVVKGGYHAWIITMSIPRTKLPV
jgi:hypothetical protein